MKTVTVNLHGPAYKAFRYPMGETQVRILPDHISSMRTADEIHVVANIKSAEDIIELALLCDAVEHESDCWMSIVLPYLPYSRADRRFIDGDCFGLEIFGRMLAMMAPNRVVTLDVHSKMAMKYIPHLETVSALSFIQRAVEEFANTQPDRRINILFPDKGARDRYELPTYFGSNTGLISPTVLHASKTRDAETGQFSGFEIPALLNDPQWKAPTLIIDDLCDGGGTFLGLRDLIPRDIKLGLYVTHGIFSKGMDHLAKAFSWIGTTNSIQREETFWLNLVIDAMPSLLRVAREKAITNDTIRECV